MVTTDLVGGNAGYNLTGYIYDRDFLADTNYTTRFGGTSSAAPLVSGVIALFPMFSFPDIRRTSIVSVKFRDSLRRLLRNLNY